MKQRPTSHLVWILSECCWSKTILNSPNWKVWSGPKQGPTTFLGYLKVLHPQKVTWLFDDAVQILWNLNFVDKIVSTFFFVRPQRRVLDFQNLWFLACKRSRAALSLTSKTDNLFKIIAQELLKWYKRVYFRSSIRGIPKPKNFIFELQYFHAQFENGSMSNTSWRKL